MARSAAPDRRRSRRRGRGTRRLGGELLEAEVCGEQAEVDLLPDHDREFALRERDVPARLGAEELAEVDGVVSQAGVVAQRGASALELDEHEPRPRQTGAVEGDEVEDAPRVRVLDVDHDEVAFVRQ